MDQFPIREKGKTKFSFTEKPGVILYTPSGRRRRSRRSVRFGTWCFSNRIVWEFFLSPPSDFWVQQQFVPLCKRLALWNMFNLTRFSFFRFSYFRRPEMSCAWSAHFSHLSQPLGARCVSVCTVSWNVRFLFFQNETKPTNLSKRNTQQQRVGLSVYHPHIFLSSGPERGGEEGNNHKTRVPSAHNNFLYLASDRIHRPHNPFVGWEGKKIG
jgi:hypothetical protein